MSNTWGENIKVTIFGESHGKLVGCVIDGLPSGIKIDFDYIQSEMQRRQSNSTLTTARQEKDKVEIVSGLKDGYTTGAPICGLIYNEDIQNKDYQIIEEVLRPGHSDYPAYVKYSGYHDYRGGGHFSARLTAPLVFAGAICKQILQDKKIYLGSHIQSIGEYEDDVFDRNYVNQETLNLLLKKEIPVLNDTFMDQIKEEIDKARTNKDSIGGVIEAAMIGLPIGVGEPFFDSVESKISSLLFSIPGVKGVEFGLGFEIAKKLGSQVIDSYHINQDQISISGNHNGGILGGLTTSAPIIAKVAFKPTSSIGLPQETVNIKKKENQILELSGRHDPCIALRAGVIVEACMALAILDLLGDFHE